MRCSWLLLLAAAGCYRSSGAPLEGPAASAPAGPAPKLSWVDNGFEVQRLPAASADGAAVLLGIHDDDGARGHPNYRFELRDRRDAKLAEHVVLTVDEAETLFDAGGKTAELDRRIAAANRWLSEQHAARRLVPLRGLGIEPGEELASTFRATGGGVTIEWRESRLRIEHAGKALLEAPTPKTWLVEDRPMGDGETACGNPAFLGGAAISLDHKLAVLTIEYGGTDMCWEPNDQHHVVAW